MKRTCLVLLCALVWLAPVRGQSPEDKKATIDYLVSLQTDGGGFLSGKPEPDMRLAPTLRATSSALRALKYFGGDARDRKAAAGFVEKCYHKDSGGFSEMPGGKPDVTTTA